MADSLILSVPQDFDLDALSQELSEMYRAEGFNVNLVNHNNSVVIKFDKEIVDKNMFLGFDL